jgi:hypothetical protein
MNWQRAGKKLLIQLLGGPHKILPGYIMSTSFNIIPTKITSDLTFENVLATAKQTMNDYLQQISINLIVDIKASIHDTKESYVKNVELNTKFIWPENEYAGFQIDQSTGGTDAYCEKLADQMLDWENYIEDTLGNVTVTPQLKQQILDCKFEWYFRRSAGQSPIVNIAFGHLAAAVAKLTEGYIYTHDGAWHDNIFPATADQLLKVYFYPGKAKNEADDDWVTGCIRALKDEFGNR